MGGKRGDPIIGASGPHGRNGRHACYGKVIGSMRRGSCYRTHDASRSRSCCERAEILLLLDHMRLDETGCLKLLHHAFVFLTGIGRKAESHPTAGFQDTAQLAQSGDGAGQTCMELTAIALSKALLSNGNLAAVPRRNSTRPVATAGAFRAWACAIISGDGSTPATRSASMDKRLMATPGPNPISNTLSADWTSRRLTTQLPHSSFVRAIIMPPSLPSRPRGQPNIRIKRFFTS